MNQPSTDSTYFDPEIDIQLPTQNPITLTDQTTSNGNNFESPQNELIKAVQQNDRQAFDDILKSNRTLDLLNILNQKGFSTLHFACFQNSFDMVKQLILYFINNCDQELQLFINLKTNEGFTALHFASYRGNLSILDYLAQHGAQIDVQNNQGMTIMHIGAQGDQPNSIVFAHSKGLSIRTLDHSGGSPLHWACYYGQELAALYLLSMIDQTKPYYPLNELDHQELSPLHLAVMSGNTKLVRKLIIYGADKHKKGSKGRKPADLALENEFNNIYQLLTKQRQIIIAYYNIKQPIKKMRKTNWELIKFILFMLIELTIFFIFVRDECFTIIDYIIFALTLLFFLLVTFINPGYQIKRQENLIQLLHTYEAQDICPQCNVIKLPRARHCEICQQCVLVYDHHCPWINNCVGSGNHLIFIIFIVILDIALFYVSVFSFISMFHKGNFHSNRIILDETWIEWTAFAIQQFIAIIFILGITLLIITQIDNIVKGVTTFERFAIKSNTSTLGSMMRKQSLPTIKTSLMEEDKLQEQNKRFTKRSIKNITQFLFNHRTFRQKENAIRITQ